MIFIIKSTICLIVIYVIYKIFLAKENAPVFKRFFLLFGILFSIVVSLLEINIKAPIQEAINPIIIWNQIGEIYVNQPDLPLSETSNFPFVLWLLFTIYSICFALLMTRYISNIIRLINIEKNSTIYRFRGYKIAVVNSCKYPHSFLNTIFISEEDYHNGTVRKEILIHELAHIRQKHSIEILFIEFMQVFFWFNPILWLYNKEIRLNHEYLADNKVINSGINIYDYQNFMAGISFRNQSSYLTSNFNYSFIKKRFIMLAKKKSSVRTSIKGTVLVPVFVFLAIAISCNQNIAMLEDRDLHTEWWRPILQKHNIELKGAFISSESLFEMGDQCIINDSTHTWKNSVVILDGDKTYTIFESEEAERNLRSGTYTFKGSPLGTMYFKMKTDSMYYIRADALIMDSTMTSFKAEGPLSVEW